MPVAPGRAIAPGGDPDEVVIAHVVDAGSGLELHRRAEDSLVPVVEELD